MPVSPRRKLALSETEADRRQRLTEIVFTTPLLMRVLQTARALALPDHLLLSGAVYQPVLNSLTARPAEYGIRDYDLGYFDASDLSYEAEDVVIRQVEAAFDEPLRSQVEVCNQARVHLWFEAHFGEPYTAVSSTAEAIGRFASTISAIGVRLEAHGALHIEAPFGLADLFALRLRPNPARAIPNFDRATASVRRRWPELVVEPEATPSSS